MRFRRAPASVARVVFRYGRGGRGSGRTGCEGIAGGTGAGWLGPYFKSQSVAVLRSCSSPAIRNLTVAHELGHVLGLGHENRRCALMNATGDAHTGIGSKCGTRGATVRRLRRQLLTRDDVRGARSIYRRPFAQRSDDQMIAIFNPGDGTRSPYQPAPVRFSSVTRNAGLSYRWNFGDPSTGAADAASGLDAPHAFSGPGTYTVTLRVFDGGAEIAWQTAQLTLFD
ncbi:MAG: PKD domain-containing protein [Solirubrobacteraceae bacterium]